MVSGDPRAVGVFDSGVGGLTVVRQVLDLLPREAVVYFGDTARSPYGPRALDEIRGFAREIAAYLLDRDVKMLVVACNSVEVAAIEDLTARAGVPVVGVIDPGVRAALRATRTGRVGVIGTEATVRSGAYDRAVSGSAVRLLSQACPAFVPFVERGDTTSDELVGIAEGYLEPLRRVGVDTLILGCTHYPLLSGLLREIMGPEVVLISSAEETAKDVYGTLRRHGLLAPGDAAPVHEFLCSGDPGSFRELGARFLGPEVGEVRATSVQPAPLPGGAPWS
ncbi:MAG: glutamate racemase [Actinomycetota bacterium]